MAKKTGFILFYDMLDNLKMLGNDITVEVLTALSRHDQGQDIGALSPQAQFAFNVYVQKKDQAHRGYPEYKTWIKAVFHRDGHTCQSCGKRNGKLNAHHIKPFAIYPELRTEISNGITLCEKCHRAWHKKHRRGNRG